MEPELQRAMLINEYHGYATILAQKGIEFNELNDEDLRDLAVTDLSRIVRQTRDLARTPTD